MKEVKIFARAGQGAITTAAILGEAFFYQGIYAYAFPSFGAARMGAPMNAFLRFDNNPVRLRSQIYNPDYVIVIDPTLIKSEKCFAGIKKGGTAIVAVRREGDIEEEPKGIKLIRIFAEKIALETIGRPFSNTVLLGAFAKITGDIKLESINEAVRKKFVAKPEVLEKNIEAIKRGYEAVA
jgi:pyruvate ferredoxin oxidoreductase gamma subunit